MVFLGSSVSLISAVLTLVLILALGFIADFLYGRFSMMKNEWNKRFTQSLMVEHLYKQYKSKRNREILLNYEAGKEIKDLMWIYQISKSRVWQIINKEKKRL